jgi:hypothetical protein
MIYKTANGSTVYVTSLGKVENKADGSWYGPSRSAIQEARYMRLDAVVNSYNPTARDEVRSS